MFAVALCQQSVTWPLERTYFGMDLTTFVAQIKLFYVMLTIPQLHEKNREVYMRARSLAASLTFMGQVTEHKTVEYMGDTSMKTAGTIMSISNLPEGVI